MNRLVGNTVTEGTGTGDRYRSRGYTRRKLQVFAGTTALALAATVAGCTPHGSASAANTASSSASATATKPNAQPTTKDAYKTAVADISKLVTACVALGPEEKATTVVGGTPGIPTTQNFYVKYKVTPEKGLTTTPDVEKAECITGTESISGHDGTGEQWTIAKNGSRVIVEHIGGKHVIGTSAISRGSSDMSPVTQAYTYIDGLVEGAAATP